MPVVKDLIMPYFVIESRHVKEPVNSMPGISRLSIDNLIKDIDEARQLGIKTVLLFGVEKRKDALGSQAYNGKGIVQTAVRALKKEIKDITVITDVCLCGYTTHGHCGIIKKSKIENRRWKIDNDETIKILAKIALSHAQAGADWVAPSAMAKGQVLAIRKILDKNRHKGTKILGYSAKFASNFYGPFREALDSRPRFGDRKSYQLDFRNSDEALKEAKADIDEGADMVMVKPALAYLDIIYRVKEKFDVPVAAYNVSGEYAMVKAYTHNTQYSIRNTRLEKDLALEILTSIKRAGADLIITYHAKEAAGWLK